MGKVAEGTKEGLDSSRPRAMACKENDPWKRPISLGVSARLLQHSGENLGQGQLYAVHRVADLAAHS